MSQDDDSSSPLPPFVPLHLINPEWIVDCSPVEDTESPPLEPFDSPYFSTETEPGDLYLDSQPIDEAYKQIFTETLVRNIAMLPPERFRRGAGTSRSSVVDGSSYGGRTPDPVHCCVYSAFAAAASPKAMLDWSTSGGGRPDLRGSRYSTAYATVPCRPLVSRAGDAPPQSNSGSSSSVGLSTDRQRKVSGVVGFHDEHMVQDANIAADTTNKPKSSVKPVGFYGPIEPGFATDDGYLCSRRVLGSPIGDILPPAWRDFERSSIFNVMRNWVLSLNRPSDKR